jgi:hypothetical protein
MSSNAWFGLNKTKSQKFGQEMGYIYHDANIALNVTRSLKFIEMKSKKI